MHLVGFIIRIYHDARSSKCQIHFTFSTRLLRDAPPHTPCTFMPLSLKSKHFTPEPYATVTFQIYPPFTVNDNALNLYVFCLFLARQPPPLQWVRAPSFTRFLDHTQRRSTLGRTPLDEWSARRKDLYLTTHNNHNKYPCPRWNSNPRSQQASGRRPTP